MMRGFGLGAPADTLYVPAAVGESLGPELVTNGDPFAAAGWTLSGSDAAAPTISGGELIFNPAETDTANARRTAADTITAGNYRVTYTISSYGSGTYKAVVGGTVGLSRTAAGEYSEIITSTASTQFVQMNGEAPTTTDARFSRFSVKRIL